MADRVCAPAHRPAKTSLCPQVTIVGESQRCYENHATGRFWLGTPGRNRTRQHRQSREFLRRQGSHPRRLFPSKNQDVLGVPTYLKERRELIRSSASGFSQLFEQLRCASLGIIWP